MSASVTISVPTTRFEEARSEIRKLGLRVEADRLEAQDVTKDYVDREARLRNLRAQEAQYLGILKQAKTVKDTLEVSDKLNEVRSEIEQQQAEFEALSKQVEMVAIGVSLRAEADVQAFGLHWRPLYQLKLSPRRIAKLGGLRNNDGFVCLLFAVDSVVACNHLGRRGDRMAHFALGCAGHVWC